MSSLQLFILGEVSVTSMIHHLRPGLKLESPKAGEKRGSSPAVKPWTINHRSGMIVTIDAKRRLTGPTALVPAKPGDLFEADFDAEEEVIVFRCLAKGKDWLATLEECPVPMDDLPPRRHGRPAAAIIGFLIRMPAGREPGTFQADKHEQQAHRGRVVGRLSKTRF